MGTLLLASLLSLQTADLGTTCIALRRGFHEMNPIVPSHCGGAIATTAAGDLGLVYLTRNHAKIRAFVLIGASLAEGFAVSHNVRALRTK